MSKYVYILATNTGSLLSRAIGVYTKIEYNHISLSMDAELNEMYSFGRKIPWFPGWGGFVKERASGGVYEFFPETTCSLYRLEVTEDQYAKMNSILYRFNKNSNEYRYNFIGLFGVPLDRPIKREKAYFCSQFVSQVFRMCGLDFWEKPSELMTPKDFTELKCLEKIFEGTLRDYVATKESTYASYKSEENILREKNLSNI